MCAPQLLGVPKENTSSSQYTITARNHLGTSETIVNIGVMTAPSLLSYGVSEIVLKPAQPVRYAVTYLEGISPFSPPFLPPSISLALSPILPPSLSLSRARSHTHARAHTHTHTHFVLTGSDPKNFKCDKLLPRGLRLHSQVRCRF